MLITPIFVKKKTKFGKRYMPAMQSFGRVREFRRIFKTAGEALSYARRAAKHFIGLYCG